MTKFLANLALLAAAFFVTLGNFWYTYGIWPKSWGAFVAFFILSITLLLLRQAVEKED
jgi:hypothetical protein